ncbi:filamin-B-like [Watersipora subatra]|uniref:filamin-B-like n=1 Tax=Watersipora subatra TaxID=2589382 RepID=UPI00355BD81A
MNCLFVRFLVTVTTEYLAVCFILPPGLVINKLTRFQVRDGSKVRKLFASVVILGPGGKVLNPMTSKVSDGKNVSFTPRKVGEYVIEVYANGIPINGSPFKVNAISDGSPAATQPTGPPKIKFANANQVKQPDVKKGKPWSRKPSDNVTGSGENTEKSKSKKLPGDQHDGKRGRYEKPKEEVPEWMNPHLKGFKKNSSTPPVEEVQQPRKVNVEQSSPDKKAAEQPKLKPWQTANKTDEAKQQAVEPAKVVDESKRGLKPWQKNQKDKQSSKVRVYGDGITTGICSRECKFMVDTSAAGPGELGFAIHGPGKATLTPTDMGNGKCEVSYTPSSPGVYSIGATFNKELVPGAPFKPTIKNRPTSDAPHKAVNVYGDGIVFGEVNKVSSFIVDTTDAGPGKLNFDIRGPSRPKISTMNLEPGKCKVSYTPTLAGAYTVDVTYNGKRINEAPFKPLIQDFSQVNSKVKVYGEGLHKGTVRRPNTFVVDTGESSAEKLSFDIRGPSKPKVTTSNLEPGKCQVTYIPTIKGDYTIDVIYKGSAVPDSPFHATISHEPEPGDAEKVKVSGDGLVAGILNQVNIFTIDTTEAGDGKVDFEVTGPLKPMIKTRSIGPKVMEVAYTPSLSGSHTITVKYDKKPVPGSPFRVAVKHESKIDRASDKVVVNGSGISKYTLNKPNTFIVDTTAARPGKLSFDVTGPVKPKITSKELELGKCEVSYTPTVAGLYIIDVKYNAKPVVGSPFKPVCDQANTRPANLAANVIVSGDGIKKGEVNQPNTFTIDTHDAGLEQLCFEVKGPCKPKITSRNVGPDKCEVSYVPTSTGTYTVDVSFGGVQVPGTPFKPVIKRPAIVSTANNVKVQGDGISHGFVNQPCKFVVDTTSAGPGKLDIDIQGPKKPRFTTKDLGSGKVEVTYTPTLAGLYHVVVKYNEKPVSGAPFQATVSESASRSLSPAEKVTISGNGIVEGEINKPSTFVIDTQEAGPGKLSFDVKGPSKPRVTSKNIGVGKCEVSYTPTMIGTYTVEVSFAGKQVPGAPFKPVIKRPTSINTLDNIRIQGDGITEGLVNKPNTFVVDASSAGPGKIDVAINGPKKPRFTTKDLGSGNFEVTYTPNITGVYEIALKYNGKPVPGTPFKSVITDSATTLIHPAEKVKVTGNGVAEGEIDRANTFVIDTQDAGSGKVSFDVRGPCKPKVTSRNVELNKLEVSYMPTAVGTCTIDVSYDGKKVSGSPFRPTIKRPVSSNILENISVYGDGITNGFINTPNAFIVDATSVGSGKLDVDIQGLRKPKFNIKDLGLGKFQVTYTPTVMGVYLIELKYNGRPIRNAPIKVSLSPIATASDARTDKVIVTGNGITNGTLNQPNTFVIDTKEAGHGKLSFEVSGPCKPKVSSKDIGEGKCEVTYVPTLAGTYSIDISYAGKLVPGTPFKPVITKATKEQDRPDDANSAEKVTVSGDGIAQGEVGKISKFIVDTSAAGPGELSFDIAGPCKPTITTKNIVPGKCEVSYSVDTAGSYSLSAHFNKKPIPGSPFKANIHPKKEHEHSHEATAKQLASKVKVYGAGIESGQPGVFSSFTVDASNVKPGKLAFDIHGPAKAVITSKDVGNNTCEVSYMPTEQGLHNIEITYDGQPVADSPFSLNVCLEENDKPHNSKLVRVFGDGLTDGEAEKCCKFLVDTSVAGPGKLNFDLKGPSKTSLNAKSISPELCEVSYVPSQAGEYMLDVLFDDVNVPGSPFLVQVAPKRHTIAHFVEPALLAEKTSSFSTAPSEALDSVCPVTGVRLSQVDKLPAVENSRVSFLVDTRNAKPGKLSFDLAGPCKAELCTKEIEQDICEVSYVPTVCGEYVLDIFYNNVRLCNGPVCTKVASRDGKPAEIERISSASRIECPLTKVALCGNDMQKGKCNRPQTFLVDMSSSGPGKLAFQMDGPSKVEVETKYIDNTTCEVSYIPTQAGIYKLNVFYNDVPVSVCPIEVQVIPYDTQDEILQIGEDTITKTSFIQCSNSKVKINDCSTTPVLCNTTAKAIVDLTESGPGKLGFAVHGPGKAELSTVDIGNGKYEISFLPTVSGEYILDVMFNDMPLSISPLQMKVSAKDPPQKICENTGVVIAGKGISSGECGHLSTFIVNTRKADRNELAFKVDGPASDELCTKQLGPNEYEVSYTPSKPGKYAITIFLGDKQVFGEPLMVNVSPSDLSPAVSDVPVQSGDVFSKRTVRDSVSAISSATTTEHLKAGNHFQEEELVAIVKSPTANDDGRCAPEIEASQSEVSFKEVDYSSQSPIIEEVVQSPSVGNRLTQGQPRPIEITDLSGIVEDVEICLPINNNGDIIEEGIEFTKKESVHGFSDVPLPHVEPMPKTTKDVESCFTISADTVVEDSYKETDHHSSAAPFSSVFSEGNFVIEASDVSNSDAHSTYEGKFADKESSAAISSESLIQESHASKQSASTSVDIHLTSQSFNKGPTFEVSSSSPTLFTETDKVDIQPLEYECQVAHHEATVINRTSVDGPVLDKVSKVRISGECLQKAVIHEREEFTVDMRESGPGNLNFSVKGPTKPELSVKDVGDNQCLVTFEPKEMGRYAIDVTYNGEHIPGSPFITYVISRRDLDVSTINLPCRSPAGMINSLRMLSFSSLCCANTCLAQTI